MKGAIYESLDICSYFPYGALPTNVTLGNLPLKASDIINVSSCSGKDALVLPKTGTVLDPFASSEPPPSYDTVVALIGPIKPRSLYILQISLVFDSLKFIVYLANIICHCPPSGTLGNYSCYTLCV